MTKLDMLVENQNLKKMIEIFREDIDKHCVDCENKMPYARRYVAENIAALANIGTLCNRCVLGKYKKSESIRNDSSVELNLIDTYSKTVKIKNPKPVSL